MGPGLRHRGIGSRRQSSGADDPTRLQSPGAVGQLTPETPFFWPRGILQTACALVLSKSFWFVEVLNHTTITSKHHFPADCHAAVPGSLSGLVWRRSCGASSLLLLLRFCAAWVRTPSVGVSPACWQGCLKIAGSFTTIISLFCCCFSRPLSSGVGRRPLAVAARREQKAMTGLLSDWQMARPNRAVVTLAGDVHIGGFTDSWVRESEGETE